MLNKSWACNKSVESCWSFKRLSSRDATTCDDHYLCSSLAIPAPSLMHAFCHLCCKHCSLFLLLTLLFGHQNKDNALRLASYCLSHDICPFLPDRQFEEEPHCVESSLYLFAILPESFWCTPTHATCFVMTSLDAPRNTIQAFFPMEF